MNLAIIEEVRVDDINLGFMGIQILFKYKMEEIYREKFQIEKRFLGVKFERYFNIQKWRVKKERVEEIEKDLIEREEKNQEGLMF